MNHEEYVAALKDELLERAIDSAFNYLADKATFLLLGPLPGITKFLLKKILSIAIHHTEIGMFFIYTDIRVNEQGRAFYAAIKKRLYAEKYGTDKDKHNAKLLVRTTFRDLVKLTN